MTERVSAFHSEYIIDGMRMELTPGQILGECLTDGGVLSEQEVVKTQIIDEPSNPVPTAFRYDAEDWSLYLERINQAMAFSSRKVPAAFSGAFTRMMIARTLIDCIWSEGHFSLGEMTLGLDWSWDSAPVGNMASFYFSAEAAGQYLYDLGVRIRKCSFSLQSRGNDFFAGPVELWHQDSDEPISPEDAASGFHASHSTGLSSVEKIGKRMCGDRVLPDSRSWIIYIPFDTCSFRLGGSLLTELYGEKGDPAPEIRDSDYFIDCYEVVRELVEDGVIISGITVADGGLITASDNFCSKNGCVIDISGIESAYAEKEKVRVLFSEVPGVLVQIRDSDFDYVDSQLILQDIAYYPLGHPSSVGSAGVRLSVEGRTDVLSILSALLHEQSSEGED